MAREKPFYRENMEILNSRYPDHDMLTLKEVADIMGWKSMATSRKYMAAYAVDGGKISKAAVANYMCGGDRNGKT